MSSSINKIGKSTVPRTAISTSDEHSITVRGEDLCRDLIGRISFTDYFSLLVTGQRPSKGDAMVLDATLVAIAEHGMVPSVQAGRMTYAAAPDALQGAVAAGILGCGSVILGASETAGRLFAEVDEAGEGTATWSRPRRRWCAAGAKPARPSPATAIRCTRSATRAWRACSRWPGRRAPACASSRSPKRSRR